MSFSGDGHLLAAGGDGGVVVWDVSRPARPRRVIAWREQAVTLALTPDGRRVVFAGTGTTVVVRDVAGGRRATIEAPDLVRIQQVAVTPDGRGIVAAGQGGARMWNLATHALQRRFGFAVAGGLSTVAIALSPDGRRLVTTSGLHTDLWDVASATKLDTLSDGSEPAALAFRPDGRALATSQAGSTIDAPISAYAIGPTSFVKAGAGSPDYRTVLLGQRRVTSSLAYSPDGRTLASGSADGTVTTWDPASPETLRDDGLRTISTVSSDATGAVLALGGEPRDEAIADESISFLDVARHHVLHRSRCALFAAPRPRTSAWIVSGQSCAGQLAIVDPFRRQDRGVLARLRSITPHEQRFFSEGAAFSPTGDLIAEEARPYRPLGPDRVSWSDGALLVWDPRTPHVPLAQVKVGFPVRSVGETIPDRSFAFSPDGRTLAIGRSFDHVATTVGDDDGVVLWDTRRLRRRPPCACRAPSSASRSTRAASSSRSACAIASCWCASRIASGSA